MNVLSLVTYPRPFFIEEVSSLRAKGVSVDVLAVPGLESAEGSRSALDYVKFYRTVLGKSRTRYDLVHANYGLTAPFALAQPHRPIVLSLWGSDVMGSLDWVTKRSAGFCAERIVMNEQMRRELGHTAHVIPHGINFDRFRPIDRAQAQQSVGWDPNGTHVLFPYDPSRDVKNYPLAQRVVEEVRETIPEPVELHAVYGIDHEDVPMYMNAADALLLTSRREGFPNAIKEAMACNLPIVSTDVGDLREWLDPVDNSYVCRSESQLSARLGDVLASDRRSDGREHISELSLDNTTDAVLDVYRQALE